MSHFKKQCKSCQRRFWWPCGLTRLSRATWLVGSRVESRFRQFWQWLSWNDTHETTSLSDPPFLLDYILASQRPSMLRTSQASLGSVSAVARLLGSWFRIRLWAWVSVSCECCVLSGRGLCDEPITRPEESFWVWCVQWVWSRSPVRGGHDKESGRIIYHLPLTTAWSNATPSGWLLPIPQHVAVLHFIHFD